MFFTKTNFLPYTFLLKKNWAKIFRHFGHLGYYEESSKKAHIRLQKWILNSFLAVLIAWCCFHKIFDLKNYICRFSCWQFIWIHPNSYCYSFTGWRWQTPASTRSSTTGWMPGHFMTKPGRIWPDQFWIEQGFTFTTKNIVFQDFNSSSDKYFSIRFREYFDKVLFGLPRLLRWARKKRLISEVIMMVILVVISLMVWF